MNLRIFIDGSLNPFKAFDLDQNEIPRKNCSTFLSNATAEGKGNLLLEKKTIPLTTLSMEKTLYLRTNGLNPGVPCSNTPCDSMVNSPFYPSVVDSMPTRTPGNLVDKSKFSPRKGSAALRQLKLTHKKGSQSFFFELKCY